MARALAKEDLTKDGDQNEVQEEQISTRSEDSEKEHHHESSSYPASIRTRSTGPENNAPFNAGPNDRNGIIFLQKAYGNLSTLRLRQSGETIQPKLRTRPTIQRFPADETTTTPAPPSTVTATSAPLTAETATEEATPTPELIVEDSVTELTPGQMKKSEFLTQLRAAVCSTAESALSGTIWSAMGCPWIDRWFGYYSNRTSQQIERAIRRYAPETAGVPSAREYIPIISVRVRRAIEAWRNTGEVTGVPEGVSASLPGAGAGGLLSGIAGAGSSLVSGASSFLSGIGGILFKRRNSGTGETADPRAIQAQLDSGHPLDSGVRSRIGSAFGQDFSHVRVHTDTRAAQLSDDLNARAFTVGRDIAFGSGEYKPGTLIGDALIAHELAHTIQQGGGSASSSPMQKGETEHNSLEEDADLSAVATVVSIWGGVKGKAANVGRNAYPLLRSGLRLQRCKDCRCSPSQTSQPSLSDYNDSDPLHDPSRLSDTYIENTKEFRDFTANQGSNYNREEILLACRLVIRHMREGNSFSMSTDGMTFLNQARRQLGAMRGVEALQNQLQWVPFSSQTAATNPAALQSDFGKWLLAGGTQPDPTSGRINCWEVILFGAYRSGYVTEARLRQIYTLGVANVRRGTRSSVGDTVESELRTGREYTLNLADPTGRRPLPGDIVIFSRAANHAAIALGTTTSTGEHEILSLWSFNSKRVERTTIEQLLRSGAASPVKFWSVNW